MKKLLDNQLTYCFYSELCMKINVGSIKSGKTDFEFVEPAAGLDLVTGDLGVTFVGPITVRASAESSGKNIVLHGTIVFQGGFLCSRCLENFAEQFSVPFTFFCQPAMGYDAGSGDDIDDMIQYNPGTGAIEITDRIREQIILALPLQPLCHKECHGLCPECGANLNDKPCTCSQKEKTSINFK
jgi:uncharacterized protein